MKIIKSFKYFIRKLAIKFYNKTEYYVLPEDLFCRITINNKNKEELQKIKQEIKELKTLYPLESSFNRAEAVVERMLILEH